jgi:hypothetical protein
MAENTEWKITPSGEKQLTVVLPDSIAIPEGTATVEPESLARGIIEWLEAEKIGKAVNIPICNGIQINKLK